MSLKTIQMDPSHLKISKQKKTKKVIVPPSVMINQPNLRQILLDKLLKHRKTQKRNDPVILNNDFDSQCSLTSPGVSKNITNPTVIPVNVVPLTVVPVNTNETTSMIMKDKPYGILKNGIKPTYKKWNLSQKNIDTEDIPNDTYPIHVEESIPVPIVSSTNSDIQVPVEICIPNEKEYKKAIVVGKSKKTRSVHVLIPCHKTRKLKSEVQESHKKTNLTTVKNYLKHHKLIKVGSTAPTNLIREIYENARSFGDIVNENKQNLLYNFEKDSE